MNWQELLNTFSGDALDTMLKELEIIRPVDKKRKVNALKAYLKIEKNSGQKKLLKLVKDTLMVYELRSSIARLNLSQPIDSSECYDYLVSNLELITFENQDADAFVETSNDIVTEETAKPEYSKKDEEEMQIEAVGLIDLFRNQNYSLGQSVSDIVDNSIDIGASEIDIYYEMDREMGCRYLMISDNGKGMNDEDLKKGMILGLRRDRKTTDLGKFGIGLKMSSLAQAEDITIFSRTSKDDIDACRRLSVSHIKEAKKLVLFKKPASYNTHAENARELLDEKKTGTVVLWESMDKNAVNYGRNKNLRDNFHKEKAALADFLSLTFERYLSGTTKNNRIIFLNSF